MQIRLLLGPAGSGKTFRCLAEIRQALSDAPDGPPLLMLAPKQSTFQLERQLLAGGSPGLSGYTRLHILSFDRLSHFVLGRLGQPWPRLLDEEGRLMVLRGLLARKRHKLKLFRASARLTGFAQELSEVLGELQRSQLTPESLRLLAEKLRPAAGQGARMSAAPDARLASSLGLKLEDLATLLEDYLDWLKSHDLRDADSLLRAACDALAGGRKMEHGESATRLATPKRGELEGGLAAAKPSEGAPWFENLWVDGFSEWPALELDLLAALMPYCGRATIALCLDSHFLKKTAGLSNWSVARHTFETCQARFEALPGAEVVVETLERDPERGRFAKNPVLRHLEQYWAEPQPCPLPPTPALRLAACADPEAEVTLAAREILRHARAGGRYREVSVLVRDLGGYHELFHRVFSRYEIPFFLDRRESVAHHPLAELTRGALRTVAFQWQHEDWFAALKTGLVPASNEEVDRLENEALARGWQGLAWQEPFSVPGDAELQRWAQGLQKQLLPPFEKLAVAMRSCGNKPAGPQLAQALRELWRALGVERKLEGWAETDTPDSPQRVSGSVHATVWNQMNAWLENVELAFPAEALSLREWLPILEAGLASLSVGVIPPALDQVLIGALDRSRNPEIKLALVLGLNEGVFPAVPRASVLLTESDLAELERDHNLALGATARQQLRRERYLAYIACTRPRERLVLTCALSDHEGAVLNPSPFLSHLRQLFPSLPCERPPQTPDWQESEHVHELVAPLLSSLLQPSAHGVHPSGCPGPGSTLKRGHHTGETARSTLAVPGNDLPPALSEALEQFRFLELGESCQKLSPELAGRIYGPVLRTSVSRLEQFAACPFKFFVHSGLRAEERQKFELDAKEQGSFQHEVLAQFHDELRSEKKRWRDVTPEEARERVGRLARDFRSGYRDGLLQATERSRFVARVLTESLQNFVATLVGWMRSQYLFDPVAVEKPFGEPGAPAWSLALEEGHRLELRGRIDRIDLFSANGADEALCVVVDYKSSPKKLDPVLMTHGLQLQLPAYLSVLRHWPDSQGTFGVARLKPAGVFYVNLRGKYERQRNRNEALAGVEQARKEAYRHAGRFDALALPWLDSRPDIRKGDQFNYSLTVKGAVSRSSREALSSAEFAALLDNVEAHLKRMGREIFAGHAAVSPYRKGGQTACDLCEYQAICRIDRWTHPYRVLKKSQPSPLQDDGVTT